MTVTTNTGKVFYVSWIGVSSIDGYLRFSVKNSSFFELFSVFSNPEETKSLKYSIDYDPETETVTEEYKGYTTIRGILSTQREEFTVILSKEEMMTSGNNN